MKDSSQACKHNDFKETPLLPSTELTGLFEDILGRGVNLRVKVTGRSMKPFLHGGETVVMRRVSGSSLVRGDLVFYKDWNGITTLHRIIRKYEDKGVPMIQTKGDALISLDEPISADQILGKVCLIEGKCSKDMESMKWKGINYSLSIIHLMKSVTNRASGSCRTLFRYVFAKKFFGNQG